ncbi:MAG TPA: response regulator [Rhodanobacteraceae bacterium]|nr:response regulator [Rhodanobacteraceae bacterium]
MMNEPAARVGKTIRIVLVEDVPADAEMTIDDLREDGIDCEVRCVDNESDYVDALDTFKPDIVLSDLGLPSFNGYQALSLLRQRTAFIPFIFVTGTMGEEMAVEALRQGATDYILKSNTMRLAAAVRRAVREAEEQRARQSAEDELIRTQRFESLALLAGGLSHDLRNLLQPMLLVADTLDAYTDDAQLVRLAELLRGCGQHGLEMVSSMLAFARGTRRIQSVQVDELFQALGLLLKGSVPRAVALHIDEDVGDLSFEANHTELQQCLLNLSLNAIQAMPEGGVLTVSAHDCELDADFFHADETAAPGRYICLTVTDTGPGMTPEVLAHLFQPFFTTKGGGTGLGLVSCRRIVDNHGGVMRLHSALGEGTRVHMYLPPSAARSEPRPTVGSTPGGKGERILVVEEEAAQLSLLTGVLDGSGYKVHASQSGTAALQSLQAEGLPALVVMDADMSLLTGVRTLAALLERDYHGAVLLLIRPDAPPDLNDLPPLEHLGTLDKPVHADALLRAVREALDACQPPRDQSIM